MSLKLTEDKNKRKGKEKNRAKLFLYIAIFLFLIWAMATIWVAMTYKLNDKTNGENELINNFLNKEKPTLNISIENSEEDKTFENTDRDELKLPMEIVLKDKTLRLKNIEKIFGEMKSPKEISANHSTFGKEVFYIYHSHSRESFLPYLKDISKPDEAYHSVANITLVGKMLGRAMEQRGVGTKVDTTDIVQLVDSKNLDYTSSYNVSRELVQLSQKENKNLEYFIDIHRDSLRKENTTTEINRAKYANLLFVVGTGHAEFEKNLQFAKNLHRLLENRYPTLSKGILQKSSIQGNGVYNQDLSPNSIIIEIGGVDNTVEELHRSTEALAEVLSDYYWKNKF
ncbi:stage II sporulation protein P [Solibacillus daqui]|uniref:stage II sporulation protein P n=1 Tax=Solibacillus daqui TaxID=2912187 RepID=UPI002366AE90|nr:stage II sporulation protein P [Solibacillus daqui]